MKKLRWRLTLGYSLITATAMLLVQIGFIVVVALLLWWSLESAIIPGVVNAAVVRVEPLLRVGNTNAAQLESELSEVSANSSNLLPPDDPAYLLAVYNLEGQQLGRVGMLSVDETPVPHLISQVVRDGADIQGRDADGVYFHYTLIGNRLEPLGVGVFIARSTLFIAFLWNTVIMLLGIGLTAFTVFSVVVGMIFSYFTARRLTERLERIRRVSVEWGAGQFGLRIPEAGQDEIGELSHHLNGVAGQLEAQMILQQQLSKLDERNRIARDLHDSVKQQLFAAIMQLASADSLLAHQYPQVGVHLSEALRLAQQAQADLSGLIHELRPIALQLPTPFTQSTRTMVEGWAARTGIDVQMTLHEPLTLDTKTADELFRILQEALANIERHSGATQVQLELTRTRETLTLYIRDNGRGFTPGLKHGIGTQSMRERAAVIGATFDLQSQPGQGTTIMVQRRTAHGTD